MSAKDCFKARWVLACFDEGHNPKIFSGCGVFLPSRPKPHFSSNASSPSSHLLHVFIPSVIFVSLPLSLQLFVVGHLLSVRALRIVILSL